MFGSLLKIYHLNMEILFIVQQFGHIFQFSLDYGVISLTVSCTSRLRLLIFSPWYILEGAGRGEGKRVRVRQGNKFRLRFVRSFVPVRQIQYKIKTTYMHSVPE